jgi:hypothetical protein
MKQPARKPVMARLKIWLLQGKKITGVIAWEKFKTLRLAAYIHELKTKDEWDIKDRDVTKNGKTFTEYWLNIPKKIDRIKTREYLNQAVYGRI